MPELPEVETAVKALNRALSGRVVEGVRFLGSMRLPFDREKAAEKLTGARIAGVRRRAKYLIFDFDRAWALLAHLGMTGRFHIEPAPLPLEKHDRVAFPLKGGDELRYADTRRFGFVKPVELPEPGGWPSELAGLGPEPLDREFSANLMLDKARGRKSCPVKVFIMDQAVVVGVGNIYASEALFAAGLDPRRSAASLGKDEWTRLAAEIKTVLRRAIRKGGSTIQSYRTVDGSEGAFQRSLRVYGRRGGACHACGNAIELVRLGGRSTFFCPRCQR